jgi:hypothetical protein
MSRGSLKLAVAIGLLANLLRAETPDGNEIMRRVAENLARGEQARAAYVFDQDVFVRLLRANGKLAREENRKYVVTPSAQGGSREIVSVAGTIVNGRNRVEYTKAGYRTKDTDIDGALVDSLAREVMWRKDAIGPISFLFPLSPEHLSRYTFHYEGEERYRDYDAFRLSWRSAKGQDDEWEGEALIERNEFQPIQLTVHWTGKIPRGVTIGLGTDVRQVGAKITYERFEKNVWFPVTFGGEMKLRVLFLYARTIAFRAASSGFRKTDVKSSIEFDQDAH